MDKKFYQSTWQKYSSYVFLNFKSKEIEKGFNKSIYNYKSFITLSLTLFISLLALMIILSFIISFSDNDSSSLNNVPLWQNNTNSSTTFTANQTNSDKLQSISSIISVGGLGIVIEILVLILCFVGYKLDKKEEWISIFRINSLLTNLSIRILFIMFDIWFYRDYGLNLGNSLISAVLRSGFIFTYVMFFDSTFYLNGFNDIFVLVMNIILNPLNMTKFQIILFSIINLNFVLWFFYFIDKYKRDNFFYTEYALKEHNNLENIFNSLNIGVVKINKNYEPFFLNKSMLNKFINFIPEEFKKLIVDPSVKDRCEKLLLTPKLKELFRNFIFDGIDTSYSMKFHFNFNSEIHERISSINKLDDISILLNIISEEKEYFNDYRYLGMKLLDYNNEECFYEVFVRYDIVEEMFEFVYNDSTRAKKIEEMKAEMKYKTIFLSKVAHEFKNPLICISELIKEIHESPGNWRNNNSLYTTIYDIKNLCEYMLILVQDFDFLSKKEINRNLDFLYENANINDIFNFAINIFKTRAILNKKNIELSYTIDPNVPEEIKTDEIRIKQVLINILSNSYKFTDKGFITLHAKLQQNSDINLIKIIVRDTGCGIPEDKLSLLTTPFSKFEIKNNRNGAGLGLGIVKDMIGFLGSDLDIQSQIGKGTEISFLLNSKTIEKDEGINEKLIQINRNDLKMNRELPDFYSTYQRSIKMISCLNKSGNNVIQSYSLNNSLLTKDINMNILKTNEIHEDVNLIYSNKSIEINILEGCMDNNQFNSRLEIKTGKSLNSDIVDSTEDILLKYKNLKGKTYRIIVVEDEELIKRSFIRNLEHYFENQDEDCEIVSCSDGVECLNILYQSKVEKIYYDAIITDVSMNFICGNMLVNILDNLISKNSLHPIKIFISTSHESIDFTSNKITDVFKKPLNSKDIKKLHLYIKKFNF